MDKYKDYRIKISFCIFLSISLISCAMPPPPQLDTKRGIISNYYQEIEGLTISVDPFYDTERLKVFFGTDLKEYGVLPVFISLENKNQKSGFLISPDNVYLLTTEKVSSAEATSLKPPKWAEIAKNMGLIIIGIPLVGGFPIPGMISLIAGGKKIDDFQVINENLKNKALIERTVFPGEVHSGFAYFKFTHHEELLKLQYVGLTAKNLSSKENINFLIKVKP